MRDLFQLGMDEEMGECIVCRSPVYEEGSRCPVCGGWLCLDHVHRCRDCWRVFCREHMQNHCHMCGVDLCHDCVRTCHICGRMLCREHHVLCGDCFRVTCVDCAQERRRFLRKMRICSHCDVGLSSGR